jgi:hypothetical protein
MARWARPKSNAGRIARLAELTRLASSRPAGLDCL